VAILLLRHAVAVARDGWTGTDAERPLDVRGREQARALVPLLGALRPARILSSPTQRCIDTLRPLADAVGCEVELSASLYEGAGEEAADLVRALVIDPTTVLCTHADVIPDVLDALAAEGLEGWSPGGPCKKGSTWVLEGRDGRITTARYLGPPA
jgi:broad specificity phosphatase PhoE